MGAGVGCGVGCSVGATVGTDVGIGQGGWRDPPQVPGAGVGFGIGVGDGQGGWRDPPHVSGAEVEIGVGLGGGGNAGAGGGGIWSTSVGLVGPTGGPNRNVGAVEENPEKAICGGSAAASADGAGVTEAALVFGAGDEGWPPKAPWRCGSRSRMPLMNGTPSSASATPTSSRNAGMPPTWGSDPRRLSEIEMRSSLRRGPR